MCTVNICILSTMESVGHFICSNPILDCVTTSQDAFESWHRRGLLMGACACCVVQKGMVRERTEILREFAESGAVRAPRATLLAPRC